jgi:hypothetical protein
MKQALRDLGLIFRAASHGPYGAFAAIIEARGSLCTPARSGRPGAGARQDDTPAYREPLPAP